MAENEKVVLELGERATVSLPKGSKLTDGQWGTSGSAAVIDGDIDGNSVELVGASVGKVRVYYRAPVVMDAMTAMAAQATGGRFLREQEERNVESFEVEVVAKKDEKTGLPKPVTPLASSSVHEGLLPMNEVQEGPSEKTPYGMDQENKPVAPHPSMTAGADVTNVARASEDATATGPTAPESAAEADARASATTKEKASEKSSTKPSTKTAEPASTSKKK